MNKVNMQQKSYFFYTYIVYKQFVRIKILSFAPKKVIRFCVPNKQIYYYMHVHNIKTVFMIHWSHQRNDLTQCSRINLYKQSQNIYCVILSVKNVIISRMLRSYKQTKYKILI